MMDQIQGYQLRIAQPPEIPSLLALFPSNPLGEQSILAIGAFGQPGDVPLGAAIVRPSRRANLAHGHFVLVVHPPFRRQKIGTRLVNAVYQLALRNKAEVLTLAELVHQDRPETAFYRAVGLSVEQTFATFSVSINEGLAKLCSPVAARFERSHPHLAGASILPLAQIEPGKIAGFLTRHYGGFVDQRLAQLRDGYYDLSLSTALVRDDEVVAAGLFRSKPAERSIYLDLVLTAPSLRPGPVPLILFTHSGRIALEAGHSRCVFEADTDHDDFAIGFAQRCGCKAQWDRYRYGISHAEMISRTKNILGSAPPAP
jgi:GNAT superfamily N-acetyltransferase